MGYSTRETKSNIKINAFSEQIDGFYEFSIRKMGLTDDQINSQNIEELKISLSVIEDALLKSDSFGKCRIGFSGEGNIPFVAKGESNSIFETGITPLLLQAKARVMSRLKLLGADTEENENNILKKKCIKYRNLWLLTFGALLCIIGISIIWLMPILLTWTIITGHKSYVADYQVFLA